MEENHSFDVVHHPSGKVETVEEHRPGVDIAVVAVVVVVVVDVVDVVAEVCGVHPRTFRTHFLVAVAVVAEDDDVE